MSRDPLRANPFPEATWRPDDKPVLVVDGHTHRVLHLTSRVSGEAGYVVGVSARHFPDLCPRLDVEALQFYEMWVTDLRPLSRLRALKKLAIRWNPKASDISPLGELGDLRDLVLEATPRIQDLAVLSSLRRLERLEFAGGLRYRNTAKSLEPIAALPDLSELCLFNLKVERGGLAPLARSTSLRKLEVSNQFPTEEYARLSVLLPNVRCAMFAPYVRLSSPIAGNDVMVVGSQKPMLNSKTDADRLRAYEEEFWRLQERFRPSVRPVTPKKK